MKTLIMSTVAALSIGAATLPATAQSITFGGSDRGSDCRTVEKRVIKNGRTVITRERRCGDRYSDRRSDRDSYERRASYRDRDDDRYERRSYRDDNDRYVERRDSGPGIYIGR